MTIDKFLIIEHLGNGCFGDVYLCLDPYLQKEVALKVIRVPDPVLFVNAVNEGKILDLCRHKNIVDVKDVRATVYHDEPVVVIIMEYLSNGSVQKHIENKFISVFEACKVIKQCLLGLEHSHNHNVLHRDIKPGNIMLGGSGEAILSDFGLALDCSFETSDVSGYLPHQPLEVILGEPMDKLSDIYAMGMTFYRLLNNITELSFTFKSKDEWLIAVKKDHFPPRQFLSHIPEKVLKILKKSINKTKSKRYQNCTEFRQALEKLNFILDWNKLDKDNWICHQEDYTFTLIKYKRGSSWFIDFKKNGLRKREYCFNNLPEDKVDEVFFNIIKETNLKKF